MRLSIRHQLLIPVLVLLSGVVGISTWTIMASARRARQDIEKEMQRVAHTLSEEKYPLTEYVLLQMKGYSGAEYVVLDAEGRRTTTLSDLNIELPWKALAAEGEMPRLGPPVRVADQTYLCSGIHLRRLPPGQTLYILYPETQWRDALWGAVWPSLVLGGFVALGSIFLALGTGRRLSQRARELVRRTNTIAAGDFSPLPLCGSDDELGDLSSAINEMARKLARYQEQVEKTERLRLLGQVSGGLAHQLRNSVAGARLAVQLHERNCPAAKPSRSHANAEALQVALRQLALIETSLKRFLDLGRAGVQKREPCSVESLVDDAIGLLGPRCRHSHIDLRWHRPCGAEGSKHGTSLFPARCPLPTAYCFMGDSSQLSQVFLNILTNGIEAAGTGGWVEARVHREKDSIVVEIADSGPGPAADVAAHLFEPFVTGKPEGVGLGLAVARQIVEAHNGSIHWQREHDRTCFRIVLPITQE